MAAETQYTANTGMVTISTANANMDGTGTLGTVLTGAGNGTLVKSISVKAQGDTTQGVVRLFVVSGMTTKILQEIEVPAVNKSGKEYPAFEIMIPTNYTLNAGEVLKASTEKAETFNIFAEGLDWAYYGSVRPESTNYTANTGMATISTANTKLDGTGTIVDVIGATANGTVIQSITVKAQVNTTSGMVRLFIYDGSNINLLTEIPVPAVTKSGIAHSFSRRIDFNGNDFSLKSGWKIKASTENAESFNVIAEALDWAYPA